MLEQTQRKYHLRQLKQLWKKGLRQEVKYKHRDAASVRSLPRFTCTYNTGTTPLLRKFVVGNIYTVYVSPTKYPNVCCVYYSYPKPREPTDLGCDLVQEQLSVVSWMVSEYNKVHRELVLQQEALSTTRGVAVLEDDTPLTLGQAFEALQTFGKGSKRTTFAVLSGEGDELDFLLAVYKEVCLLYTTCRRVAKLQSRSVHAVTRHASLPCQPTDLHSVREKAALLERLLCRFQVSVKVPEQCVHPHVGLPELCRMYENDLKRVGDHLQNTTDALFHKTKMIKDITLRRERILLHTVQSQQLPQLQEKVYTKSSGLIQDSEVKAALRLDGHPAWKNARALSNVCDNLDLYVRDSRLEFTGITSDTKEVQEIRSYGPHTYEYVVKTRKELMAVNPSALYPVWKMVDRAGNLLAPSTVMLRYVNSVYSVFDRISLLLEGAR